MITKINKKKLEKRTKQYFDTIKDEIDSMVNDVISDILFETVMSYDMYKNKEARPIVIKELVKQLKLLNK